VNPGLLGWLTRLLWTPKPTREVLGLPRSIAARLLETLEPIADDTPPELADAIRTDAHAVLEACLEERGVPDGVYALLIESDPTAGHRIQRRTDGRSWTLNEFDEYIDLGLYPGGS